MSIWTDIGALVSRVVSGAAASVIEAVRTAIEGDPITRRQVAFSVAMVALSAKMAKADGIVTFDEMQAFHDIFHIPEGEERNVARLFDLAKQDTAGFLAYAAQIETICGTGDANCPALEDILDGLFHIAKADGAFHESELEFLEATAVVFKLDSERYQQILPGMARQARWMPMLFWGSSAVSVLIRPARRGVNWFRKIIPTF